MNVTARVRLKQFCQLVYINTVYFSFLEFSKTKLLGRGGPPARCSSREKKPFPFPSSNWHRLDCFFFFFVTLHVWNLKRGSEVSERRKQSINGN